MPNPEEGNEWVELYNPDASQSANLSGWKIDDQKDGGQNPKTIDNLTIPPKSYAIFNISRYFNDNDSDQACLLDPNNNLVSQTNFYPAPAPEGLSWSLQEDGSWCFTNPSPNQNNNPCPTPTPTATPTQIPPTITPTPTPTDKPPSPTPTPFARLKINKPKDESGKELNQVKIYLDDVYLHSYPPEELKFCSGCTCRTNSGQYGSCDFGKHIIKLVKTGYQDWLKEVEVAPGDDQTLNPQMQPADVSSTSTPTPTPASPSISIPPSTSNPNPTLSVNLTATPLLKEASESVQGLILGQQVGSLSSQPTQAQPKTNQNNPHLLLGTILIISGSIIAIIPFVFPYLTDKIKSLRS